MCENEGFSSIGSYGEHCMGKDLRLDPAPRCECPAFGDRGSRAELNGSSRDGTQDKLLACVVLLLLRVHTALLPTLLLAKLPTPISPPSASHLSASSAQPSPQSSPAGTGGTGRRLGAFW